MWFWILSQVDAASQGAGTPPVPEGPPPDSGFGVGPGQGLLWLLWLVYGWGRWLYLPFFLWMLISCLRNDSERHIWLWIILIFQPLGAVLYFLARWLPGRDWRAPSFLRRWTRGREIERLEIAASQIGNAHHFIELGDALRESGQWSRAAEAYHRAIAKEGSNLQALWGAACVDFQQKNFAPARDKLAKIIARDPGYKFGDVSLLYGKTLTALDEVDQARAHLEGHIRRWRHPEALFLLATLYSDAGQPDRAREQLQALIMDVNGSPRAIARKHLAWRGRAKRLLSRLPRD